jgi:hypothetical protein
MSQRSSVEGVHRSPILCLERQVMAPGEQSLRGYTLGTRNKQLVRPEVSVASAAHRDTQHIKDGRVEGLAVGKVTHYRCDRSGDRDVFPEFP